MQVHNFENTFNYVIVKLWVISSRELDSNSFG